MIAQAVNFGVVFLVLYFYAIKPLSKLMKERGEKIQKGIDDSKENAGILLKTKSDYEKVIEKANKEANDIFDKSKKEAEAKKTEMLENAKMEVVSMIENGKKALEAEKKKAVEDAKKEIADLALLAAEKILQGKADTHFDNKTVRDMGNMR
jgi:F-type H+-transporting ATPase subunit b